jgi:hypothetical protein
MAAFELSPVYNIGKHIGDTITHFWVLPMTVSSTPRTMLKMAPDKIITMGNNKCGYPSEV